MACSRNPTTLHLADPLGTIIAGGGEVFLALQREVVVGTCGIHPTGDGVFELVKLTVDPEVRGQGVGRRLTEQAIAFARAAGARQVVLCSNSQLTSALRLYESLGFRHRPLPDHIGYTTADVAMELDL